MYNQSVIQESAPLLRGRLTLFIVLLQQLSTAFVVPCVATLRRCVRLSVLGVPL